MRFILLPQFVFLLFPISAIASVQISEIMYDLEGSDSKREWIEIHNLGDKEIDLTGWRLYENGVNHKLVAHNGSMLLGADSYAVIADDAEKFLLDNPVFSGLLFDSSFSLKNSGEKLVLRNADLEDVDTVLYDPEIGAGGDGNSLQMLSDTWLAGSPTPARANISSEQNKQDIQNENSEQGKQDASNENQNSSTNSGDFDGGMSFPVEPQISVFANVKQELVVGADSIFSALALGLKEEPIENARYIWNFGDGSTAEGERVWHHYKYPGDYYVVVVASSGKFTAMDKIKVMARQPDILISDSMGGEGGFVELYNRSNKKLDISFWKLSFAEQSFYIPEYTQILANTKLKIPAQFSGIVLPENMKVNGPAPKLYYPNGEEVKNSKDKNAKTQTREKETMQNGERRQNSSIEVTASPNMANPEIRKQDSVKIGTVKNNDKKTTFARSLQGVSVYEAGNKKNKKGTIVPWYLSLLSLVFLLAIGVLFVYLKEREGFGISGEAKSFEILD